MQMDEKQRIRNAVEARTWEALRSLTGSTYASDWILFHRYVLTSDGSLYPLTTDTDFEPSFDSMVSMEDLKRVCPRKCISWSCRRLPSGGLLYFFIYLLRCYFFIIFLFQQYGI